MSDRVNSLFDTPPPFAGLLLYPEPALTLSHFPVHGRVSFNRERVSEGMEEAVLHFENVFTGGVLIASYRRGAAVLRSDSASTLAIVKELVSKEATARRLQITDTFQVGLLKASWSMYRGTS